MSRCDDKRGEKVGENCSAVAAAVYERNRSCMLVFWNVFGNYPYDCGKAESLLKINTVPHSPYLPLHPKAREMP